MHGKSYPSLVGAVVNDILTKLYCNNGTLNHTPITKYHRRRNFWLPFMQTRDKGYLEINATLQPSMDIDESFTNESWLIVMQGMFQLREINQGVNRRSSSVEGV